MKHYLYNQEFGKLTVTAYAGAGHWFCRCECGGAAVVSSNHLVDERVRSCGCMKKEQTREKAITRTPRKKPETKPKLSAKPQIVTGLEA